MGTLKFLPSLAVLISEVYTAEPSSSGLISSLERMNTTVGSFDTLATALTECTTYPATRFGKKAGLRAHPNA
jgi:hypothetical protein